MLLAGISPPQRRSGSVTGRRRGGANILSILHYKNQPPPPGLLSPNGQLTPPYKVRRGKFVAGIVFTVKILFYYKIYHEHEFLLLAYNWAGQEEWLRRRTETRWFL